MAAEMLSETDVRDRARDAFVKVDATLPAIARAMEALGLQDEASDLALVQYTLEAVRDSLEPIWDYFPQAEG